MHTKSGVLDAISDLLAMLGARVITESKRKTQHLKPPLASYRIIPGDRPLYTVRHVL